MHLLLIEDEPLFIKLLRGMLASDSGKDPQIIGANSLALGLKKLKNTAVDAVLLDLNLPDSQGMATVQAVRAADPAVPIIVLTGLDDERLFQDALDAGADDYLIKNELRPSLLSRVIRYATERRKHLLQLTQSNKDLEQAVRRRTEQLERAKLQWETTFDAAPDFIAILDTEHRIIRANRALAAKLGLEAKDLVGAHCFERLHGTSAPPEHCPHTKLLADHKEHMQEIREDSLGCDMLISTSPLFDQNNKLYGSVHVLRDITALKMAERAVTDQLSFLQSVLDAIPNPVLFRDFEGSIVGCNLSMAQLLDTPRDQIVGQKANEFLRIDPPLPERVALGSGPGPADTVSFETTMTNPGGEPSQHILYEAPYTDTDGKPAGGVVVLVDISQRKQMELALRDSQERYRYLIDSLPEGVLQVDPDLTVYFCNNQFASMLGYEPQAILGKKITAFMDVNGIKATNDQWELRKRGKTTTYENTLVRKDGEPVQVRITGRANFDHQGEFVGAFSVVNNITDLKAMESQLMQSQKLEAIGQLAAGIAHEINTPTQFVSDNTFFLRDTNDDLSKLLSAYRQLAEKIKADGNYLPELEELDDMAREVDADYLMKEVPQALQSNLDGLKRIAKIVRSMKEFAHPGLEGKLPTDINKAVENTITVARNEWKYVARVETDLDPALPTVPCVASELNQVLLNLVVNAAQAIGEKFKANQGNKGLIQITTAKIGDFAEIKVADNGPGVPKKIRARIFDPFFTTKEPGKGTGQGLAIAYRAVVDTHGGKLDLESSAKGTTFIVRLPLEERA